MIQPIAGMHRRLAVNSLSNVGRYAVSVGIAFFLTPFVVTTLGDAGYGLWTVLLAALGYAGMLEIGVRPAVVKVISQYGGGEDPDRLERLLAAAFAFFVSVGVLAAAILAVLLPRIVPVLAKDPPVVPGLGLVYWFIAFDVFLVFLNTFLTGLLYGWQLYTLKNAVDIGAWLLHATLVVLFLPRGGLLALAGAKVAGDMASVLATGALVRRMVPDTRWRLQRVTRDSLRQVLGFGGKLFVSATTTRIATHAHPLIIGSRISITAVTFFVIPLRLVDTVREVAWALAAGFMPMFSQLEARNLTAVLRSVYLRYSRYILAATLPVYVLLFTHGAAFIGIWIGPEYGARAALPLRLIALAAWIEGLQPLAWRLFIGVGRLRVPVAISAAGSLAAVSLSFLLAPVLGLAGPGLALVVTALASQVLYAREAARYLQMPALTLLARVAGRIALMALVLLSAALGVERWIGTGSLQEFALGVALVLGVYVPLLLGFILHREERELLWRRIRQRLDGARKVSPRG